MNYYSSYNGYKPTKKKSSKKWFLLLIVALLIGAGVWYAFLRESSVLQPQTENNQQSAQEPEPQKPSLPNLQPVVDEWVANHPGTYAIKITDTDGNSLAEVDGDRPFFAASIYKLYVAYIGYQKIADGTYNPNEPYSSGYSRLECLDEMIRSSFSPCAEKMWAELGKDSLTALLKNTYGLTGTNMTALRTTPNDAAIILGNIYNQKKLSKEHRDAYLDSMKTQDAKYRRGLPSGITNGTVYNKVGWNLDQEWHDTAIIELQNDKTVIVSIFTEGAGYRNVASLGAALEQALQ